jgi:hypothetical protein
MLWAGSQRKFGRQIIAGSAHRGIGRMARFVRMPMMPAAFSWPFG